MGKNRSEKAKAKKEKLKQERASTAASLAAIKAAYAVEDPLDELFAFKSFRRNGLDIVISFHKMASMVEEDTKWAFELLKTNMKTHYVRGGMGWKDRDKWDELTHDNSCFLLAKEKGTSRPVAFVSYRYDIDEGDEVVYCYEIQLEPEVRRKGLGKFLMQILELIGHRYIIIMMLSDQRKRFDKSSSEVIKFTGNPIRRIFRTQMKKIVLTIFKENEPSNQFFRKCLNYDEDQSSPSVQDPLMADEYSYYILSKPLIRTK